MKAVNKVAIALLIVTQITSTISFAGPVLEVNSKMRKEQQEVRTREVYKNLKEAVDSNKISDMLKVIKESFVTEGKTSQKSTLELKEQELQRVANIELEVSGGKIKVKDLFLKIVEKNETIKSLVEKSTSVEEKRALYQKQVLLMQAMKNLTSLHKTNLFAVDALNAEGKQGLRAYSNAIDIVIDQIEVMDVDQARSYYKVFATTSKKLTENPSLKEDEAFRMAIKELYKEDAPQKIKDLIDCLKA